MSRVSIYLNFQGNAQEAFEYYAQLFGSEVTGLQRMRDVPGAPVPDNELDAVMHAELQILDGTVLMATDMLESMGHKLVVGNNVTINLEPDTLAETQRLYEGLSAGGSSVAPLEYQFWGAWWGTCLDRFGVRWMFNSYSPPPAQPSA